jgi:hypothetical protein
MCEPTLLLGASLAMSGVQAVVGYQAANAQFDSQMDAYEQNAEAAAMSTANAYSTLNIRAQQEGQAHAQAAQASEIERARAVASTEVAAAAGGVSGLSVDAVLRDVYAQAGRNEATADANLRMSRDYLTGEMAATEANGQSQINSMPIPEKPSMVPFLLGGFSSALGSYTNHVNRKNS